MMKKTIYLISSYMLLSPVLLDCNSVDKSILITELNIGTNILDRCLELSNVSNETINLSNYSIKIYRSFENKPTEIIKLNGFLLPYSSYLISYSESNNELKNMSNLVSELLTCEGSYPLALAYKNKNYDVLGTIGLIYDYSRKGHLVRKKEKLKPSLIFDSFDWIRYLPDTYQTLGNYECISKELVENGPKLTENDLEKPFVSSDNKGGGGLLKTTVNYYIDGDTTNFEYGTSLSEYGIVGGRNTRYYGINTPEIAHGSSPADPYGNEASDFTRNQLMNAKNIFLQSIDGYNLTETYGRMLTYIWISDKTNPSIEDYSLLNFLIIKNGFSKTGFINRDATYVSNMSYNGISYVEYLYAIEDYAKNLKINIYS